MSGAVIRTVVDPASGETMDIMARRNHNGQITYQRLAPPPDSPRALENRAIFGETATRAYGRRKTGRLPPAAEEVERVRPGLEYELPADDRAAAKQRRYAELLGDALPEVQQEVIMREIVSVPTLRGASAAAAEVAERRLRELLATARAPYLR